ncbi:hypothetical protein [Inhella sp.]|uniref:hypothetical protein n=1 Tax=Inhella sp. TaxID=1921806 RepID=UPI0035B4E911
MDQLHNFADERLLLGCAYCRASADTRDHVPPKVLLDAPFPENLPVVGACRRCNNGFSMDEEYVACLLEVAACGSVDPALMRRPAIARILERSPKLKQKLEVALTASATGLNLQPEPDRLERFLVKLAKGHAAFELAQECPGRPAFVWWHPIHLLDPGQRERFESPEPVQLMGEIGSRGMQRLRVLELTLQDESGRALRHQVLLNDWIEVQPGRYRYHASDAGEEVRVRMAIGEYLAAEVAWASP